MKNWHDVVRKRLLPAHVALRIHLRLVVTTLVVFPAMARSAEDGGGRSVFGFGAGNRALAMGGAFAAIADDASAPIWNPGGLALVERQVFEASHTSLYGLGIRDQYASFVLPSWRWGVGAVTLRHFGVSGVDVRDDRNVVLQDDVSDGETELALSYGRPIGKAWSVGGSFKLQRQSLVGFMDTGLGIDAGVVVRPALLVENLPRWADRVTVGLALRNLIEPSIRLDRDNVSDPRTTRFGMACSWPLGSGRTLLGALDIDKTRGMNGRVHLGVEARLHPMLLLRSGVRGGMMTAGTGILWRDASFDYVLENNLVGSIHRLGVTFRFGPTVAESRQAALDAEEAALSAKLAEAFRTRQTQRIEDLLAKAGKARERKHYDEALEVLTTVKVLDEGNVRARELEVQCLREKARSLETRGDFSAATLAYVRVLTLVPDDQQAASGRARCRAESDHRTRRSAEIRERFATALDAFAAEDFVVARLGFTRILQANPNDQEAASMLRRTQDAIRHRTRSLAEVARRLVRSGSRAEAGLLVEEIRALDPGAEGLRELAYLVVPPTAGRSDRRTREDTAPSSSVETGAAKSTRAKAVNPPVRLSPEKQREVEVLYKRGMAAMDEGRREDAVRYWELVWSSSPDHQRVGEHLKREYLMRGMESFAEGHLGDAVRLWEKALRVDPTDERTLGYLARAQEQMARTQEILGGED